MYPDPGRETRDKLTQTAAKLMTACNAVALTRHSRLRRGWRVIRVCQILCVVVVMFIARNAVARFDWPIAAPRMA